MDVEQVNSYIGEIYSTLSHIGADISRLPHNPSERQIDNRIHKIRQARSNATFDHQYDKIDELLDRLYTLK